MRSITLSEYNAIHPDFRSVWNTERTDLPDWEQTRDQYMGKRTMMSGDGTCSLLIEGLSFVIVDDSQPKHTPGPWEAKPPRGSGFDRYYGIHHKSESVDGGEFAEVRTLHKTPEGHAIQDANARLIAAAPDLLAAARSAIIALDMHDAFGDDINARHAAEEEAFGLLTSAIAKATVSPESDIEELRRRS